MTTTFRRLAAAGAVVAAGASIAFTVTFAVVVREGERWAQWSAWTALLGGALASLPVVVALYARLVGKEPELALLALVLGVAGALGATVHAAFELAVLANPPESAVPSISAVDPRGVMTFAVTGLALGMFGWLIGRTGDLSPAAGRLASLAAVLLIVVYVGRLTVLDPEANAVRVAALLSGLVVVPAFYLQVARTLRRPGGGPAPAAAGPVTAAAVPT